MGATEVVLCGVGFEVGYALRSKQTCITAVCPLDRSGIKLSSGRVCLSICGVGIRGVGGGGTIFSTLNCVLVACFLAVVKRLLVTRGS